MIAVIVVLLLAFFVGVPAIGIYFGIIKPHKEDKKEKEREAEERAKEATEERVKEEQKNRALEKNKDVDMYSLAFFDVWKNEFGTDDIPRIMEIYASSGASYKHCIVRCSNRFVLARQDSPLGMALMVLQDPLHFRLKIEKTDENIRILNAVTVEDLQDCLYDENDILYIKPIKKESVFENKVEGYEFVFAPSTNLSRMKVFGRMASGFEDWIDLKTLEVYQRQQANKKE